MEADELGRDPSRSLEYAMRQAVEVHAGKLNQGAVDRQGIDGFADAYDYIKETMRPYPLDETPPLIPHETLQPYFKVIYYNRLLGPLLHWFLQEIRNNQWRITVEIEAYMAEYESSGDIEIISRMLMRILKWWEAWGRYVPLFNHAPRFHEGGGAYRRICTVHLNSALPGSFRNAFRSLILSTFPNKEGGLPDPTRTKGIFNVLTTLCLLNDHEHIIGSILKEYTQAHVVRQCAKQWTIPMWKDLKTWFTTEITPWIELAYTRKWMKEADTRAVVDPVNAKYQWHLSEALAKLRISEIFDIIVGYPDSLPALSDLKECMSLTGTRRELVTSLRASIKKRLLHPGADTRDIITGYISTIRCLRVLDSMGSLLFSVADPIRQYLRERPDTIRTIVQNLIEPKGDFVAADDDGEIKPLQDMQHMSDDYGDFAWMPEPADAEPGFRTTKQTDIISTLVSIYDSKDIFVKELQALLAKRLLEIKNNDYEAETRNLEILKLRFGDASLQVCDVMMKDVTDSRRSDQQIHASANAQAASELSMHTTIISRLFWPTIPSNQLVMPRQFRLHQERYAAAFSVTKPDRKIRFLSHLGTVSLDVELQDRTVSVTDATPLQAGIIDLFSSQETWRSLALAERLGGVDISNVDKALEYWIDYGVIKSIGDQQFHLLEVAEENHVTGLRQPRRREEHEEQTIMSIEQQQAEQMRVFWQFIQGMLTNFSTLPTDRIHTMLKFAPGYDRTREQLAAFMESLRREGLVDLVDGNWRLRKTDA